jgi:CheY-like chemotaxis protein
MPGAALPSADPAGMSASSGNRLVRRPCVLVVDDVRLCRAGLGRVLARLGYDILLAGGGDEALEHLRVQGADIVMTDLHMPGMSGRELIMQLRLRLPDMRVIAFTGLAPEANAGLEAHGIPLLTKPFSERELDLALRRVLTRGAGGAAGGDGQPRGSARA